MANNTVTSEEQMKKVQDATDILFGKNVAEAGHLAKDFEEIHRSFAYNFILAGDDALISNREACNLLVTLEMIIDGLRGKNIDKK